MNKLQHTTIYYLHQEKLENNMKVVSISDLHFSNKVKNEKLESIYLSLLEMKPHYITICGDLIDSLKSVKVVSERNRLTMWLEKIATIAPVMIAIGNHDCYPAHKKDSPKKVLKDYKNYLEKLMQLKNVYLLNNASFEDKNIYIAGLTLPKEYYKQKERKKGQPLRVTEDKDRLLKALKCNDKLIHNLDMSKIKLVLIHSPIWIKEEEVEKELNEFDYIISGHMHNGCVPPVLNEIWKSSYGLIAPNKSPFPKNARNKLKTKEDKLLVNGALVTFQKTAKWMQIFNFLFPIESNVLEFTNDPKYNQETVISKSKYYKIKK